MANEEIKCDQKMPPPMAESIRSIGREADTPGNWCIEIVLTDGTFITANCEGLAVWPTKKDFNDLLNGETDGSKVLYDELYQKEGTND